MLVLCRSPIVALHLLLATHIAHTFVLLTANVEDVKKIARKFVSDELAEKIADFIARATETFSQQSSKASEENLKDNSQVSAENRMYNIERHGFESLIGDEEKSKDAGKDKAKTSTEKKKQTKSEDTDTTDKPRKETKGRSRYIIESKPKETSTEKPASKASEEDYNQMKDSINLIENNLISASEKTKTKKQKQKRKSKAKPYKLLSNFDSDENNDVKDETPNSQEKKEMNQRSFNDEIVLIRKNALENDNEKNKAVKVPTLVRNEPEYYENVNVNTKKNEKLGNSGSLVIENDDGAKWWEKELPTHNQDDANLKKKSWF